MCFNCPGRSHTRTLLQLLLGVVGAAAQAAGGAEWPIATPTEVGLEARVLEALAEKIESDPGINTHAVLVVRQGRLVFERYFSGTDEDWGEDLGVVDFDAGTLHDIRSISKSITSALVGIAIGEGRLPGPEADAFTLFSQHHEQLAPEKHRLKLGHILTMTAGLDWFEPSDYTNPGNDEIRLIGSSDPVAFVLGRSFASEPGGEFAYNGGLPTLLGYLLEQAYGKPGDEILREKLLEPLGIEEFDFHSNASGMLAYASGIRLRPRDLAKIGELYLRGGRWQGQQVIPETWVRDSLSTQVHPASWAWGYGYQWWVFRLDVDGQTWDIPMGVGNGNQRLIVVEPLDLVMVVTSGHYNQGENVYWGTRMLMEYVLPAAGFRQVSWVSPDD